MTKDEYGYDIVIINGKKERLYYIKSLSTPTLKAYIFTRWAKKRMPFITSGVRSKDDYLVRRQIKDNGWTDEDLPENCDKHHHPGGAWIEWIPIEIHRVIHHGGPFAAINRG